MAPRWPLEAHFELFWALVAELLPDGLWRLILSERRRLAREDCQRSVAREVSPEKCGQRGEPKRLAIEVSPER